MKKNGFTLVELLVVIAIIGVLIALLLPAVQAAREAARRMQCSNHVKQIVLALQNYHDTTKAFPPGCMSATGALPAGVTTGSWGGRYWNTWVFILPFMEQQARYDRLVNDIIPYGLRPDNGDASSYGAPFPGFTAGTHNANVSDTNLPELYQKVPTLLCPSDVFGQVPSSGHKNVARGSYATCRGDRYSDANKNDTQSRGVFSRGNVWMKISTIPDGTSNTIAVSEAVSATSGTAKVVRGGLGNYAPASTATDALTQCWNMVDTADRKALTTACKDGRREQALFAGYTQATGFSTIMPPNGPSCATGWSATITIATAQSCHPGGVHIGRVDGSAAFISDTINSRTGISETEVAEGPSPYGVWGALGTVYGSESVTL